MALSLLLLSIGLLIANAEAQNCRVAGAEYNADSKRCECKNGYEGVGDLCCATKAEADVCTIVGDPKLKSVEGQLVNLNIPCSLCVGLIETKAKNGQDCMIEVLSSRSIEKMGAIYTTMVTVGVSVNRKSPEYFVLTEGRIKVVKKNRIVELTNGAAAVSTTEGVQGETISLTVNGGQGLLLLDGCGTKVTFRPEKEGTARSGLCMQAPNNSIRKDISAGNICALKSTFNKQVRWDYGVLDQALNIRLNFDNQQLASVPEYDDVCREIDDLMDDECYGISLPAIEKCGALLHNSLIRLCLATTGAGGVKTAQLFKLCMDAVCSEDEAKCKELGNSNAIRTCMPSLTKCNV